MARFVVFFAVWIFLAGCADKPTPIKGDGQVLGPPAGWIGYCERHPEDQDCR